MSFDRIDALYAEHATWLRERYDEVLEREGWEAVVIHSGSARKRTEFDDQYWPVRPSPHLQHWVALHEPDAVLLVQKGRAPLLARINRFDFWEHPFAPESDHFKPHFEHLGVEEVSAIKRHLPTARVAFIGDDRALAGRLGFLDEAVNPREFLASLDALRTRKTRYEVACVAEANRRASMGHHAVVRAFEGGAGSELTLHLEYLAATSQDDPETPYKNIVALGTNAATLHHVSYGRRVTSATSHGEPESLLLDAGATCMGYCSDITRTWVRGRGSASADIFRALVEKVDAMQQGLCAAVREGAPYESLHDRSHDEVGRILHELGVVRCAPDEAVKVGVTRAFYPHGLGHSLGLQCHDVGCALTRPRADNPFLRNTSVIAEGQVFTIEPGVYFIDGLLRPLREGDGAARVDWALVDALTPFGGVRIEDDLLVTGPEEHRNMTREHLPRGGGDVS